MTPPAPSPRPRITVTGVIAAVLGAGLFVSAIQHAGLTSILDGMRSVGWGFVLILGLSGLRTLCRAVAWTLCSEGPARLRLADTFPAFLTGEALGNLTPLGLFVSEPTKAVFVRHRVSLMTAVSGLAIENLLYTLSVAVVIASGTVAMLFSFDVPRAIRIFSVILLIGMLALLAGSGWVLGRQVKMVSPMLNWLHRRRWLPDSLSQRLEKLRHLEDSIYGFHRRHPQRMLSVLVLEAAYHVAGVAEVFVILAWISHTPTLLVAFVFETMNRATNVVFKFVPMRLGVDEAGSGLLSTALGYGSATGVTLAIVRKVRVLFWTAIGLLLLANRGLRATPSASVDPTEQEQPAPLR